MPAVLPVYQNITLLILMPCWQQDGDASVIIHLTMPDLLSRHIPLLLYMYYTCLRLESFCLQCLLEAYSVPLVLLPVQSSGVIRLQNSREGGKLDNNTSQITTVTVTIISLGDGPYKFFSQQLSFLMYQKLVLGLYLNMQNGLRY